MSGHSKWSNIQHRKQNKDFQKSKKFSKCIKEIFIAVKQSGINNFHFKNAIVNAKSLNIPKKTIERTIEKALQKKNNNFIPLNLEGKIHGISMIIECLTDNNIRTISNIKTFFNKSGGTLCKHGELSHFFNRVGSFLIKKKNIPNSIEEFELMMIDFGANDFFEKNNKIYIYTKIEYFGCMKNNLERLNIFHACKLKRIPKEVRYLSNNKKEKVLNLIEKIQLDDDVDHVYCNLQK
ncbi:YebC/PmpR family DNA-binding transcriptional regulator [Blattabacterium cuenoti]|uniref:YebC/PmpR family DNA-binding transcriptional regulator n=1 Tax=Blattabacterium cuenoti TaxID=1653831 RepID=UPI00163CD77E|nr:YebC/PmpR family DNA-binding transcriptional regulator [Blattabacterium cuenoti]